MTFIVDDDYRVRESLQELLAAAGLHSIAFGSAAEYVAYPKPDIPACLILDVELPDINGLDLQRQLGDGYHPPIIFVTGHGNIPSSVRAIKAGALDFLTKPFNDQELLTLVHAALDQDRERRAKQTELDRLKERYESLTQREREVLPLVVSGLLNKQSAAHLRISEVTLQIHRANVMRKMGAYSLADLVRMAGLLQIPVLHSRHA
jgi:FixJ family two-component response regulator